MVRNKEGNWEESPVPEVLPSNQATVIDIRSNVFFASVYSFDEMLPYPENAKNAIMIIRVRDRRLTSLTGLDWFKKYHDKMEATGNQLMISGVSSDAVKILEKAEAMEYLGAENIFPAEAQHFASTKKALKAAEARIAAKEISKA